MAEPTRTQQILDQRLHWAWNQVSEVGRQLTSKQSDRYGTLARKLPSLLQVNGLGQTLAFLFSKRLEGKKGATGDGPLRLSGDGLLLVQLGAWLAEQIPPRGGLKGVTRADLDKDPAPLMNWLVGLSPDAYRRASHEARICAEWLKRFAEGRLGEEDE